MDQIARRKLIESINEILDNDDTLPVVTLADFFTGNTDEGCVGVNLLEEDHPGFDAYRDVLEGIAARPDVRGVYIEVTEIPDLDEEDDDDIWPTACVAFVITSASLEAVQEWTKTLHPREVSPGWCVNPGIKVPVAEADLEKDGMKVVRVWLL
jgi:hypothetical protein